MVVGVCTTFVLERTTFVSTALISGLGVCICASIVVVVVGFISSVNEEVFDVLDVLVLKRE